MNTSTGRSWRPKVAKYQAWTFTTAQAIAEGLSVHQLEYRLKAGILCRVAGDGLRHSENPVTAQMLAYAANLTWPDTMLCGPSAAALFGAPVQVLRAQVISPDNRKARLRLQPHRFEVAPHECALWRGLPVTTPKRSFLEALVMLPRAEAESLFAWTISRNRLSATDLEQFLEQYPGRRGNKRLRVFAGNAAKGILSPAEELAHEILTNAGVTGWEADVTLRDDLGILARVDIYFAAARLAIEIDGKNFHGADRFQADRTRDNLLISAGYRVLRFTWEDLTRRPRLVVARIEEARAVSKSILDKK